MVINMLTWWFNFELNFGVPSHLNSFRWWRHLAINGITRYWWLDGATIVFDLESSAVVRQKRCHLLESVCPSLILQIHMKQQNIVYNYSRALQVKYHAFYIELPRWQHHDAPTFDLGVHQPLKLVTRCTQDCSHCFGCDHYALKFI